MSLKFRMSENEMIKFIFGIYEWNTVNSLTITELLMSLKNNVFKMKSLKQNNLNGNINSIDYTDNEDDLNASLRM